MNDEQIITVLDKMIKQCRDSIDQYNKAGREDLVVIEQTEIGLVKTYLPQELTEAEMNQLINQTIKKSGAASMQDMNNVMALLKPQLSGRAELLPYLLKPGIICSSADKCNQYIYR